MITITKNAMIDELTDADYLDILEELLQAMTLRQLAEQLRSAYSHAYWGQMRKTERPITRIARNELRAAMKMQPLPPTVAEAVAVAHENSEVVRIGVEVPTRIYMLNGAETPAFAVGVAVTPVTRSAQPRQHERVFDMPRATLAYKIRERVEV